MGIFSIGIVSVCYTGNVVTEHDIWKLTHTQRLYPVISSSLFSCSYTLINSFFGNSVAEGMINKPRSFHRNYRHCNNNVEALERRGDGCDPPQSFSLIDVLSVIIGRIYMFLFYPNRKGGNFA